MKLFEAAECAVVWGYWPGGLTPALRSTAFVMWMLEMAQPRMFTVKFAHLVEMFPPSTLG